MLYLIYKDINIFCTFNQLNSNYLDNQKEVLLMLVTLAGFEPATSRAEIYHSIQLNYRARYIKQMYQNTTDIRYI